MWMLLWCAILSVGADAQPQPGSPFVVVLGTAQDGGLPQAGCDGACCRRARARPDARRRVASLLVVDPGDQGGRLLIDATPDFREQVALANEVAPPQSPDAGRPPLFHGIFLTHAHVGHYAGLLHLGREAYGANKQRVYCTERMAEFLSTNGPWERLVSEGHVELQRLVPNEIAWGRTIQVLPFLVPHRDEYSDTIGLVLKGPNRSLLYIPDIDKWERWDQSIEEAISRVDVALLDGTFFADGEIPGRSMKDIPHPFIEESLARFASLPASERAKIKFTHLNHTNPAAMPRSNAARRVRAAGMSIASEGEVIPL